MKHIQSTPTWDVPRPKGKTEQDQMLEEPWRIVQDANDQRSGPRCGDH